MRKLITAALAGTFLLTAACTTTQNAGPQSIAPATPGYTSNFMVVMYDGFNPDGTIRQERPLTSQEARMILSTSEFCRQKTAEVHQLWLTYGKNMVKGGILQGLGVAVGAVLGGFTKGPLSFGDYLVYGGFAGMGGGAYSASVQIDQALKIVHGYCVSSIVDKNSRDRDQTRLGGVLRDAIIIPLIAGRARLPRVDPNATSRYGAMSDDGGSQAPIPPVR